MSTIKEEQMRADFEKSCPHPIGDIANAVAWETYKDCAESYEKKLAEKDAEIEALLDDTQSLANDLLRTEVKLSEANACNAAAQLHIKELREALEIASDYLPQHWDMNSVPLNKIERAIAKQPDTRALDKALLEARIDEMENVLAWHPLEGSHEEYQSGLIRDLKAKLAELNKEMPE